MFAEGGGHVVAVADIEERFDNLLLSDIVPGVGDCSAWFLCRKPLFILKYRDLWLLELKGTSKNSFWLRAGSWRTAGKTFSA